MYEITNCREIALEKLESGNYHLFFILQQKHNFKQWTQNLGKKSDLGDIKCNFWAYISKCRYLFFSELFAKNSELWDRKSQL